MTPEQLHGRRLAILLTATAADGEADRVVLTGTVSWDEPLLVLDRGPHHPPFEICPAWLHELRRPDDEERDALGDIDYVLVLRHE